MGPRHTKFFKEISLPKFRTTVVRNILYEETVEYVNDAKTENDINLADATFFLVKQRKQLEVEPVSVDIQEVRHFPTVA